MTKSARTRATRAKLAKGCRDGLTLIEVMMALTLLGLLAVSHTALTLKFAQRQKSVALGAYRNATLSTTVGKYMTMPFDSLVPRAGCKTVAASASILFGYTRCVNVTAVTSAKDSVQIILTPASLTRADTVFFIRSKNVTTGPLGS